MRLTFGGMTRKVNIFNLGKQPRDLENQTFEVNLIENLTSEHREELELENGIYGFQHRSDCRVCCE